MYIYNIFQKRTSGLQLSSLFTDNNKTEEQSTEIKRRREMNNDEKEEFDAARQHVIDAYRMQKKRKEMRAKKTS